MSLEELSWRLITEEARSGAMNMALDEAVARSVAAGADPVLRVYRWQPSTLSLGYHQDPATIDWDGCRERGVEITRRPTGGGAIYHDRWGDISYSIIQPAEHVSGDLLESYHTLCEPVLGAFDRMGIEADFSDEPRDGIYEPACYLRPIHPAHDIIVGEAKISGNAQYRQREVVIQHGSITFESDPSRHMECFAGHEVDLGTFSERVTDVRSHASVTRGEAVDAVEGALAAWADATEGEWQGSELRDARKLSELKYRSEAWNRDGDDPTK